MPDDFVGPHEAQRRALITLLRTLGYHAAADVLSYMAGANGTFIVHRAHATDEDAQEVMQDAIAHDRPCVIIVCD